MQAEPGDGVPADAELSDGLEAQEPAPSTKLNKRNTIIGGLVTLVVLALVVSVVIPKFGGFAEAWQYIRTMPLPWLFALLVAIAINLTIYVLPYQAAIPNLSYGPGFVVRQSSFAVSNGVPGGGAVGLAVQYPMLLSYGITGKAATAGIGVTSVWSVFMTLGIPVLGVLALLVGGDAVQSLWVTTAAIGVAAIVGSVVVFWLILRSEESAHRVGRLGQRLLGPLLHRLGRESDLTHHILHFREQIVDVVRLRWRWITVSNLLVIFAQFLILYVAILSVGGRSATGFTVFEAFAAFAISRMATMIPIPPGGLGTVDAALIALLVGFGLPESVGVAAALLSRACSFIPQVSLGIATFLWWRVRQARAGVL